MSLKKQMALKNKCSFDTFFSVCYSFLWAVSILSTKKGAVDKREGSWFFNTQHVWLGNNTPKQPSTYQPSRWKAGTGKSTLVFLDKTSTFKQYYIDWGVYRFWHLKILLNEWTNIFLYFSNLPIWKYARGSGLKKVIWKNTRLVASEIDCFEPIFEFLMKFWFLKHKSDTYRIPKGCL